jgi:hypothetical protein
MDEATEITEGKKAHQQFLAEYGAYADPRLQAYVSGVGQKLAKSSHRSGLPSTFVVLDSPEINAGAQRATRQQDAGLGVLAAKVLGAVLESQGVSASQFGAPGSGGKAKIITASDARHDDM